MGRVIKPGRYYVVRPDLGGRASCAGCDLVPMPRKRAARFQVRDAAGRNPWAPQPSHKRGLGDVVEKAAKPIARWIDARHGRIAWLGWLVWQAVGRGWVTLPLAGCSECSRRRRLLNALVPDVGAWWAWWALVKRVAALVRRRPRFNGVH